MGNPMQEGVGPGGVQGYIRMMLTKLGISGRIFPNPGMPAMPLTNFFREVFPRTLTRRNCAKKSLPA